ncbi:hypothetical protein ACIBH1_11145 [Nonomuraea sp. NPDC050663]|uniref:hypothetical protein n=1 Tax=Nonomuraea sp. NPDC050663 TaxID=3364370 RepID=UPI0037A9E370
MDLSPYIDSLRRELALAAEATGEEARALAERLAATIESATRLALLEALSAAADEITRDLAPGSVDVRLRGRDPHFVVTPPPTSRADDAFDEPTPRTVAAAPPAAAPADAEEGAVVRVALRVPEHLKPRIDEAAGREGLSVNSWLVRVVSAAIDSGPAKVPRRERGGQSYTGWVG